MFKAFNISHSSKSSTSEKTAQGDFGPFLKKVAMKIEKRWKVVAHALDFTDEQCEEFERKRSVSSWWPAYMMLHTWQTELPPCSFGQLREILADAVRPVDSRLADTIIR